MKLVFITNYVHHHQIPLADEFYGLLGDDYKYIATDALPDWLIKGGYDPSISRPYVIRAYENDLNQRDAKQLVNDADYALSDYAGCGELLKKAMRYARVE